MILKILSERHPPVSRGIVTDDATRDTLGASHAGPAFHEAVRADLSVGHDLLAAPHGPLNRNRPLHGDIDGEVTTA